MQVTDEHLVHLRNVSLDKMLWMRDLHPLRPNGHEPARHRPGFAGVRASSFPASCSCSQCETRVMCGFPLKIGERGLRGHIKVRRDKRHHLIAREKLLEDRCCISRLKLDNSNRFAATPARELRLASGTDIVYPAYLSKSCH